MTPLMQWRAAITVIAALSLCSGPQQALADAPAFSLEGTEWASIARAEGLDPYLLYSVGLVESRTLTAPRFAAPHPWTLNSPEGSEYHADKAQAVARAKELLTRYGSLDLGLLQISWRWHGRKFAKSPDELLDPETNLRVGAKILAAAIKSAPHDRELGIGRYHRWDEHEARVYGGRVLRVYHTLQGIAGTGPQLALQDPFF